MLSGVFLVFGGRWALRWFLCIRGEQRVLVAAPRFMSLATSTRYSPFGMNGWVLVCQWLVILIFFTCALETPSLFRLFFFALFFCAALVASFSATQIVRQTDQKIYLLLLTFG